MDLIVLSKRSFVSWCLLAHWTLFPYNASMNSPPYNTASKLITPELYALRVKPRIRHFSPSSVLVHVVFRPCTAEYYNDFSRNCLMEDLITRFRPGGLLSFTPWKSLTSFAGSLGNAYNSAGVLIKLFWFRPFVKNFTSDKFNADLATDHGPAFLGGFSFVLVLLL